MEKERTDALEVEKKGMRRLMRQRRANKK